VCYTGGSRQAAIVSEDLCGQRNMQHLPVVQALHENSSLLHAFEVARDEKGHDILLPNGGRGGKKSNHGI
jgi:hypothetical protein